MKLGHVIETLDLANGGPSVGTASFAAAQAAQGHDVWIACYDSPGHEAALREFQRYPAFDRVRVETVSPDGFGEAFTGARAAAMFEQVFPGSDFISMHGVWRPMLDRAIRITRRRNLAYSVVPHGMLDPWSLKQKAWKKKPAWWLIWREHCDNATFIRVLNADEARLIEPLALKSPLELFPNGVFPEHYSDLPAPGDFYAGFPQLRQRRYILFLSRLHYKKGLDYLIEAFAAVAAKIDDVDLVVAGPDDGARAQLERDIQRLQLDQRVHLTGPLYGRDKLAALVDAYCFCLPSRQEGFSIAITEALACGTPVVISEPCNFPEVAEVNAGRVVELRADLVADALVELLESQTLRDAAGRAGQELVFSRFSWHAIIENWLHCVERLRRDTGDSALAGAAETSR